VEFTVLLVRPGSGIRAQDVELPGSGTYVAVFDVQSSLAAGVVNLVVPRGSFNVAGHEVTHEQTVYDAEQRELRVRVHLEPTPATHDPGNPIAPESVTLGAVMRGVASLAGGWLLNNFIQVLIDHLKEVRRVVKVPDVALVGAGALALLVTARG
jgi:hypothetical protein